MCFGNICLWADGSKGCLWDDKEQGMRILSSNNFQLYGNSDYFE